jgi:hypothetical protein
MRTTTRLVLVLSLVAAVGISAVPVASAAKADQRGFQIKGKTAHKKQKKAIRKVNRRVSNLKEWNQSLSDWNNSQQQTIDSLSSTVGAIVAGVPEITGGLLALQDALENTVAPALLQLQDGLLSLADFVTADEYGYVQVTHSAAPTDTTFTSQTPVAGCFYQTPNIPDNVQGAYLSGTCLMTGVAPGRFIHLMAGVRSNENDGSPERGPTAVAGIVAYEQQAAACAATPCGILAGGGATGPNGALGGAPAVPIDNESQVVNQNETSFPFGPVSTDVPNMVDLTQDATFTGTPADPIMAGAGNIIRFTVRFVDISADAEKTGE